MSRLRTSDQLYEGSDETISNPMYGMADEYHRGLIDEIKLPTNLNTHCKNNPSKHAPISSTIDNLLHPTTVLGREAVQRLRQTVNALFDKDIEGAAIFLCKGKPCGPIIAGAVVEQLQNGETVLHIVFGPREMSSLPGCASAATNEHRCKLANQDRSRSSSPSFEQSSYSSLIANLNSVVEEFYYVLLVFTISCSFIDGRQLHPRQLSVWEKDTIFMPKHIWRLLTEVFAGTRHFDPHDKEEKPYGIVHIDKAIVLDRSKKRFEDGTKMNGRKNRVNMKLLKGSSKKRRLRCRNDTSNHGARRVVRAVTGTSRFKRTRRHNNLDRLTVPYLDSADEIQDKSEEPWIDETIKIENDNHATFATTIDQIANTANISAALTNPLLPINPNPLSLETSSNDIAGTNYVNCIAEEPLTLINGTVFEDAVDSFFKEDVEQKLKHPEIQSLRSLDSIEFKSVNSEEKHDSDSMTSPNLFGAVLKSENNEDPKINESTEERERNLNFDLTDPNAGIQGESEDADMTANNNDETDTEFSDSNEKKDGNDTNISKHEFSSDDQMLQLDLIELIKENERKKRMNEFPHKQSIGISISSMLSSPMASALSASLRTSFKHYYQARRCECCRSFYRFQTGKMTNYVVKPRTKLYYVERQILMSMDKFVFCLLMNKNMKDSCDDTPSNNQCFAEWLAGYRHSLTPIHVDWHKIQ